LTVSKKIKFGLRPSINPNSVNQKTYYTSVFELFIAALIWGASFIFVKWGLEDFSTSTLMFWRCLIAFIAGEAIHFFIYKEKFKDSNSDILLSLSAGLCLGFSISFQIQGLLTTTVTKSSFITSLYVILIPIVSFLFFKQKIRLYQLFLGCVGFVGMALLLNIQNLTNFQISLGDFLTLICAGFASFQIILVGRNSVLAKNSFRFNNYQTFWCLMSILPFLIYEVTEKNIPLWPATIHLRSLIAMLGLALMVSLLAFFLQVKAQKKLNNTTASLLCLIEAPSAFVFATFLLNEKITGLQGIGIISILLSSLVSVYLDRPKK
jgi:drug/metabolite transporter (DMT)-like permease